MDDYQGASGADGVFFEDKRPADDLDDDEDEDEVDNDSVGDDDEEEDDKADDDDEEKPEAHQRNREEEGEEKGEGQGSRRQPGGKEKRSAGGERLMYHPAPSPLLLNLANPPPFMPQVLPLSVGGVQCGVIPPTPRSRSTSPPSRG